MYVLAQVYSLCILYLLSVFAPCNTTTSIQLETYFTLSQVSLVSHAGVVLLSGVALAWRLQITFSGVYGASGKLATFTTSSGGYEPV